MLDLLELMNSNSLLGDGPGSSLLQRPLLGGGGMALAVDAGDAL